MADIAASNVTYTVAQENISHISRDGRIVRGSLSFGNGSLTYDPSTGIPLDKGKLSGYFEIKDFMIQKVTAGQDVTVRFDKAGQMLRLYEGVRGQGMSSITIQDDDCAASNGVAIYVHKPEATPAAGSGRFFTHLECANANNADASLQFSANGPLAIVEDNDCAATGNAALFLDEANNRLMADLDAGDHDVFLQLSDGSAIKIHDVDDPGCSGVQLYFDDDAANAYERLLAVTAGNADVTVNQEMANLEVVPTMSIDFIAHVG